jgi:hypothetical protein
MIDRIRTISDLHKTIFMLIIWICVIALLIILSGCDIIKIVSNISGTNLEQTSVALDLRSTQLALQATQLYQGYAETALATRVAQAVQSSLEARTQSPIVPHIAQGDHIPGVAATDVPGSIPAPVNPPSFQKTPASEPISDEKFKTSQILLIEDMAGRSSSRYIKDALDSANYNYTDVGSAQGWLKNYILTNGPWDLIIVASESRAKIQGEFFDMLLKEIHSGTAVIIEIWDGDALAKGKLGGLLSECGVEVHGDWYNPGKRSIYWLIPEHPIFQEPNQISNVKTNYFWADDIGDFMRLLPEGDASLLAGSDVDRSNDHGLLTTCFGGRVVIQSFSDHDYDRGDMMRLWQNYVYYTLKNHFLFTQE